MKLADWYESDPRRRPFDLLTDPRQPSHHSLGTRWTDEAGERWTVRWAPATGEVYAFNDAQDVQAVGTLASEKEYWAAWTKAGTVEHVPGAFDKLTDLLSEPAGLPHPDDVPAAPDAGWELEL